MSIPSERNQGFAFLTRRVQKIDRRGNFETLCNSKYITLKAASQPRQVNEFIQLAKDIMITQVRSTFKIYSKPITGFAGRRVAS